MGPGICRSRHQAARADTAYQTASSKAARINSSHALIVSIVLRLAVEREAVERGRLSLLRCGDMGYQLQIYTHWLVLYTYFAAADLPTSKPAPSGL